VLCCTLTKNKFYTGSSISQREFITCTSIVGANRFVRTTENRSTVRFPKGGEAFPFLGVLFIFLAVTGVAVTLGQERKPITLQEQIEFIRAKYKQAKPVLSVKDTEQHARLYSVKIGKKYGYMDSSGSVVIEPKFKSAGQFSEGLALVELFNYYEDRGFIDRTGDVLFHVNFPSNELYNATYFYTTEVGSFHDGMARVELRDPRLVTFFGFIDMSGNLAIAADFEDARDFSEGVAAVSIAKPDDFSQVAAGFIYPNGRFAIEPSFEETDSYSEGIAGVRDQATHKWGYIDHHGSYIIPPKFDRAWRFSEGLALVETSGKRQFVDRSGNVIAGPFATAYPFSEGTAAVNVGGRLADWGNRADFVMGGKWGYIDRDGKFVIPAKFDWALPFSEGLAGVNVGGDSSSGSISRGKWGFVDAYGSYRVDPSYDTVSAFSGGLANVGVEGPPKSLLTEISYSFIDKTGKKLGPKP
jgi:hypothetical protein